LTGRNPPPLQPPPGERSRVDPEPPVRKTADYQELRDIWSDYNDRQKIEHELINRKTTWLLTGESILFAAYGVSLRLDGGKSPSPDLVNDANRFQSGVAWAGLSIAAAILLGVAAIIVSKVVSWRHYEAFYGTKSPDLPQPLAGGPLTWGVHNWNTGLTLVPDVAVPIVFIVAWSYLLCG